MIRQIAGRKASAPWLNFHAGTSLANIPCLLAGTQARRRDPGPTGAEIARKHPSSPIIRIRLLQRGQTERGRTVAGISRRASAEQRVLGKVRTPYQQADDPDDPGDLLVRQLLRKAYSQLLQRSAADLPR